MNIIKIAEGAYFFPSYSEQTIAWYPMGYTMQGLVLDEVPSDETPVQSEDESLTLESIS